MTEDLEALKRRRTSLIELQAEAITADNDDLAEELQDRINEVNSQIKRFEKAPALVINPAIKKEESKKKENTTASIQWKYEEHNKEINPNQWIIETERKGGNSGKESFEAFKALKQELYRRKEGQCLMALVDYFGENEHHFRLVLYQSKFESLYGFSKSSYSDSLDALLYYGILEPTWRIRVGTNGGKGRVMIFHTDFQEEELSKKDKYSPKNPEHKAAIHKLKEQWKLTRK